MDKRFLTTMMVVIGVAGLLWLVFALVNYRQSGTFNWGGIVMFAIVLAALAIARSGRSRPS